MSDTYLELYYHLVWATKKREAYVTPEIKPRLYSYMRSRCRQFGMQVHALNGTDNHVHVACSIPATICVADVVKMLKGASAHALNHSTSSQKGVSDDFLAWQPGYGALTFGVDRLIQITNYIDNQDRHHAERTVLWQLERIYGPESRRDVSQSRSDFTCE